MARALVIELHDETPAAAATLLGWVRKFGPLLVPRLAQFLPGLLPAGSAISGADLVGLVTSFLHRRVGFCELPDPFFDQSVAYLESNHGPARTPQG